MDSRFMAKIMANIRDFQNNVRKAQSLAKTSIPDEIETDVKADISKFQRALQRAKAMAMKWREHNVDIDGNASPLRRVIDGIKAKLAGIREKNVKIDGNNSGLKRAIASSKIALATLFDKTVRVNFDTRGLTRAQILTRALGQSLDEYGDKMDALATKIRTFGTIFGQQIKGVMIASVQALIPVIAGLVPALMAVLNAVGVLGGGVIGLAGAFSVAGLGAVAMAVMGVSAIKMLNDGLLQSTDATDAYKKSLQGLKDEWTQIIKMNADSIFGAMSSAMNGVQTALKSLTPFLSGVADLLDFNAQKFEKWVATSNTAKKAFQALNTVGVQIFGDLLNAAGRFGDGLVNIFTQFMPLFKFMSQGLQNMSISFQKWANSVAGQNAIQSFIEYTKTNLPKIGQIFANVFMGIGNLMHAFAANSAGIFDWLVKMTGQFRTWSEQVGKSEGFKQFIQYVQQNGPVIMSLIGNIIRILVAFGTAMAPIASALLNFINGLAQFVAKLFEAHPAVAKIIGVLMILGGAMWALMAPIIAIGSLLSNVFGMTILQAITSIGRFIASSSLITTVVNVLKGAFGLLMTPIASVTSLLEGLAATFSLIFSPIGMVVAAIAGLVAVIVYLWKTNADFRNMIIEAWNGITTAISTAISAVVGWLTQLWNSIMTTLQPIMPILQALGQMFMQILGVAVMGVIQLLIVAFQALWTAIQVIFTAIGAVISAAVQLIVGIFTAFIQFLSGDFSGAWTTLYNTISNVLNTIWSAIVSIFNQISSFIFSILNKILGTNITSWGQIWSAIVGFVTRIWSSVTSWFGRVAQSVWQKMVQAYNYIVNTARNWVISIISAMVRFVQGVVNGFHRVVDSCRNGMQNAWNAIKNFVGRFVSVGLDLMRGLVNGIKRGMSWVVDAARNVASSAVSAAKRALGIHSPSRVFRGLGEYVSQGLGIGILTDQNKPINAVRNVAKNLTNAFQPDLNTSLSSDLTDGLGGSLNGSVDAHMSKDVRHSLQENNRPIVNVNVRNESDIPAIKSYIEETNSKAAVISQF
ncbi:phage tail protein [Staphylococcus lugdunensis]|uniref:phage tail protein n=1 Tax=Staphylococcus lugdunensis TaxID=28035 RepID=UPI002264182C|nr:terminase [Staphylococcus lugdunensis]UZW89856.1 terminase [Staphylococcus lugdunensis]